MSANGTIREYVRAAFAENLGLKILSLVCAVALWAFTRGPETAERTVSVSVVSMMPPDSADRQLVSPLPTDVLVTLRGPRGQLDDLHTDDVGPLSLDLRGARDAIVALEEPMFRVPAGLSIVRLTPQSIKVAWEDVIQKPLRVEVPRTGEPATGFAVRGVVTSVPVEVHARGPRSMLDVMQVVRAAPFDVGGLTGGLHTLKLPLDSPASKLVTYDVDRVTASVEIQRQLVTKTFSKLKVEVIGAARGTTRPPTVTVIMTGTAEDLNAIAAEAVVPRVEPKGHGHDLAKPGNDNLPVLVDAPKGVVTQIDPPKVVAAW
jgi:hypothetical protein